LEKLGRVVSISDGKLVLKTDELIKLGSEVYDDSKRHVGTVVDYFGPTMGPYLLVSPKKDPGKLVGEFLYG
jgi:rRNA processing protein Gar1